MTHDDCDFQISTASIVDCNVVRLGRTLEAYYHIQPVHAVATLLDPKLKSNVLSEMVKSVAVTNLKKMVSELTVTEVAETADSIDEPDRKKLKTDEHYLADLINSTQSAVRDEVDSYLASSDTSDNVLELWQQKSKVWPRLSACV